MLQGNRRVQLLFYHYNNTKKIYRENITCRNQWPQS